MDIEQSCAKNFNSGWDRCEIKPSQKNNLANEQYRVWEQSAWQEHNLSNKWARDLFSNFDQTSLNYN